LAASAAAPVAAAAAVRCSLSLLHCVVGGFAVPVSEPETVAGSVAVAVPVTVAASDRVRALTWRLIHPRR
jgi:hypothetical protein